MRSGGFGGFAYFITRDTVEFLSTWQWLSRMEAAQMKGIVA
ncbi:hypothetical protein FRUB_04860 [Fimbriiglobus ruber]|uniref:Uncharacterized protein n=2 Tax=Fimbriiglobus ruber TaxID=1908690 RepID=A0A225DQT9_9BACT|nr:hypothetical protein FRUB_04860 [Fimbriiglobus ruber]